MKINTVLATCIALCILLSGYDATASQLFRKKTKENTVSASASKPSASTKTSPYKKLMKEVTDSARGGFVTLYRTKKDKIYMEFPKKYLGRRMLIGGTISSVSDPAFLNIGLKYNAPLCLQVELKDTTVFLIESQEGATSSDSLMRKAMEKNYVPKTYARLSATPSKDSSAVIFDITSIVNGMSPKGSDFSVSKSTEARTTYFGRMKAFADNASIELFNNVDFTRNVFIMRVTLGTGTVSSKVSFLLLPEKPMRPRIKDSRIGVFSTGGINRHARYDLSNAEDGFRPYSLANRWRLELSDTSAWLAGKTVAVKNPIVWYIDNTFPELWKDPIRQGVLAWNSAFEKIGLSNVMQVRDFPTEKEDPEFDPDNLKYSCLRYVPDATMNAMGPSWVDPVSGEILNASVIVYNDVVRLINNWRFVQTAQVDPRVRVKKMPDEIIKESLTYVISHEIGHTLGLMHNMSASAAIPVEKLRDSAFTAKFGTTASIMDYARFNYVAQPGDKGVSLVPPSLGVYDEYAIKWLYTPQPATKDMWEEAEVAGKIIDAHAGDPFYRYGAQQINTTSTASYDPSALSEDLGDDPIKAGSYGIKNLKYILPKVNEWICDDYDFSHRAQIYSQIATQYNRYLSNVLMQVGGIFLYQVKEGTCTEKPAVPVRKNVQKASIKWVAAQLKDSDWLNCKDITSNLELQVPYINKIAVKLAASLSTDVPERVMLASTIADGGYTIRDYYDDLYREFFAPGGKLSNAEKTLQRNIVSTIAKPLVKARSNGIALATESPEDDSFMEDDLVCFGESAPTYQKKVDISSISELTGYQEQLLSRVMTLAKSRRNSGNPDDRAHYEYLYRTTTAALGE
ncbi:MAG: zinc-dependent metalloprotease [Bacteroidales bacterium]|nr:zinc-dependent metalloprotease [Bacteroidales bacterium]MDY2936311.1 zinc-dependent metalloprotease [Candidatus Cryptobacteroides sp.]